MWGWVALNAAYLIYAASGLFRDMMRLRLTLILATALFIVYGIVSDIWSVFWWNLPVGAVHLWHVGLLVKQRRGVRLNAEAEAVRTLLYNDLDRVSFNTLWHASEERLVYDQALITKGAAVEDIFLILDGEVDVDVKPGLVVRLGRLRIVGEMSSLSDASASATVTANGFVRLRAWNRARFAELIRENPEIERAHLRVVSQELNRKLS